MAWVKRKKATYETESLDPEEDDGTMPRSLEDLRKAVVGHSIVSVEQEGNETIITLDTRQKVKLVGLQDCCAYTEVQKFLLHPELVNHAILGIGTTGEYTKWHIYADLGDILELTVSWSSGNPFYYAYGFDIVVDDAEWSNDDLEDAKAALKRIVEVTA